MTSNLRSTLKSVKLQEFHQLLQGNLLFIFYLYFCCWCFHKDGFLFELMLTPQSFLLELLVLPQDDDE
jgi:hypothetical protein